ncbi:hypothetical protein PoB_005658000 [Plakobranchus ocellatus]|uniref:Uncharacterized protein n=1 Tax=Plakobranchus ocellatus TaxID=259542 RepID=A0AAV4CF43_9GAST|nr:hypothetical protein PoB_005658000 [Plakobranchus ocellatus]
MDTKIEPQKYTVTGLSQYSNQGGSGGVGPCQNLADRTVVDTFSFRLSELSTASLVKQSCDIPPRRALEVLRSVSRTSSAEDQASLSHPGQL